MYISTSPSAQLPVTVNSRQHCLTNICTHKEPCEGMHGNAAQHSHRHQAPSSHNASSLTDRSAAHTCPCGRGWNLNTILCLQAAHLEPVLFATIEAGCTVITQRDLSSNPHNATDLEVHICICASVLDISSVHNCLQA